MFDNQFLKKKKMVWIVIFKSMWGEKIEKKNLDLDVKYFIV